MIENTTIYNLERGKRSPPKRLRKIQIEAILVHFVRLKLKTIVGWGLSFTPCKPNSETETLVVREIERYVVKYG